MSYGKLNIWIKNEKCQIVKRSGHLHIYDCQGNQILPTTWFVDGHADVDVPPGCYIITAGVVSGNIYTDKTLAMVKCGEDVCVNLVLNNFKEQSLLTTTAVTKDLMSSVNTGKGCTARFISPLIFYGTKANIPANDLIQSLSVFKQAANLNMDEIKDGINDELAIIKSNYDLIPSEEDKAATKEYIAILENFIRNIY